MTFYYIKGYKLYLFNYILISFYRVSKKTEKSRKSEKKITKKTNREKNRLKFWKNRPVRFGFISLKPKKLNRTEPKPKKIRKNPSQTKPKPSQTKPKSSQTKKTESNRFEPVFLLKNRTESKPIGLNRFF